MSAARIASRVPRSGGPEARTNPAKSLKAIARVVTFLPPPRGGTSLTAPQTFRGFPFRRGPGHVHVEADQKRVGEGDLAFRGPGVCALGRLGDGRELAVVRDAFLG